MPKLRVPREKIPWFPTIDYDTCIGDQECYNFCKNDVFRWDEAEDRPRVVNPYKCVLGCNACAQICLSDAISFPALDQLREATQRAAAEAEDGTRSEEPATPTVS